MHNLRRLVTRWEYHIERFFGFVHLACNDGQAFMSPLLGSVNMERKQWIVVTTVQPPTPTIAAISALCEGGWSAVVIGDTKTPQSWSSPNITYLSVTDQVRMFGKIASLIPVCHYSRKNLGYLYAIKHGAQVILETDDDNIPEPNFGRDLQLRVQGQVVTHGGWVNVYRYFTDRLIWPRGLSLEAINSAPPLGPSETCDCPVQQYLADEDPDVDAIYRLLYKQPVRFRQHVPIVLQPGVWCPFNSQNTAFFRAAFALLYLPCHVSFRMTDIWRSFVAQAALWTHGYRIAFRSATVRQVRNDHDLMRDFNDEVVGYTRNDSIVRVLLTECGKGPEATIGATACRMWQALVQAKIVSECEIPIVDAWHCAVAESMRQ